MVQHFHKPENALKRARELMEVGKPASALKALHDVIASKRHRSWTKTSEEIQLQFLELCVEMRRGKTAKDGLHQYKNMCQQVNIQSLETVIRYFIKLSEAKAEEARSKASEQLTVLAEVDDLEEADTPEDLILSTMTTESTQDRTDREVLTPWLKFLWETYRTVLEILRNNPKLENLYQETAQHAFQFCLKYQRKTEFRRLCDLLRQHLQNVQKYANQANTINLNNPESLQLHLETRFAQLKAAAQLELWQEAFRSIEDIHGLIGMSKKAPKPQMMAAYFEKLAAVFWKSGNYLFHAYAWQRLFYLSKEQKRNLSQEEASMLATNVLLATLVIPVKAEKTASEAYLEIDNTQEKQQRLALLVGLTQPPTRASLIRDLKAKNVLKYVAPELQMLYQWVEDEFHPLQLCDKVAPLLEYIKKDENLDKYTQPLHQTIMIRLLQQLSKVYQTMQTSVLCDLATFATRHEIEKFLVEAVKNNTLQARINHRSGTISFGADMFFTSEGSQDQRNPNYAAMQTENMRHMLTSISRGLTTAMTMIAPQRRIDKHQRKAIAFQKHLQIMHEEHKRVLERKLIIEERKIKAEKDKERALKEAERLRPKPAKVEPAKAAVIAEAKKKEEQIEQINLIQKQNEDEILRKVVELEEEKKKLQAKLKHVERKNDHMQRALRLAEIPKLVADCEARKEADLVYLEEQYKLEVERLKQEHKRNLEMKKNMEKMADDLQAFIASVRSRHEEDYKQELEAFNNYLEQELERRKEERARFKEQRRREREEEERRRAEEEERRRQEEEERRLEEERRMEAERQARLEAERKAAEQEQLRKEREEERARLDELAAKQREREREAEERLKQRLAGARSGQDDRAARPRPQEGGWRGGRDEPRDEPARDREWGRRGDDDRDRRGGLERDRGYERDRPRRDDRGSEWSRGGDDRPRERDFERGPPRDERGPPRDRDRDFERGPPRDERGPPRDRDRDFERGPPRDDRESGWRREGAPAPRGGDDEWSRGRGGPARQEPPRGGDRDGRREERRDDGGWARRAEPAPAGRDSEWRRGASPPRRGASPQRRPMSPDRRQDRDRDSGRGGNGWQRGAAPSRDQLERPRTPEERPVSPGEGDAEQDDGFTTVTKGKRGGRR